MLALNARGEPPMHKRTCPVIIFYSTLASRSWDRVPVEALPVKRNWQPHCIDF
jgi:hypothetical protein